jgi:hypothetical protein
VYLSTRRPIIHAAPLLLTLSFKVMKLRYVRTPASKAFILTLLWLEKDAPTLL